MPVDPNAPITITAFDWVPDFAKGHVRDLRVRWALEEVGQSYAVRLLAQGDQKEAAHRRLQPFGQVPTYEEGDLTLFESGAILWHIAERFPGLMPEDGHARAKALEWMIAALNTVEPYVSDRIMATLFEAAEPWSEQRLPAVDARLSERLKEAADRLGEAEWYTGSFTAGDLMMVSVLRALEGESLLDAHPNLAAYVARGTARPAFRRALADQMAGFTGNPPEGIDPEMADRETYEGADA